MARFLKTTLHLDKKNPDAPGERRVGNILHHLGIPWKKKATKVLKKTKRTTKNFGWKRFSSILHNGESYSAVSRNGFV